MASSLPGPHHVPIDIRPAGRRFFLELRRRAAAEPVIGHLKAEHCMGRNSLWFRQRDAANAVLAAAGYNFRRLIRWPRLCCAKSYPISPPRRDEMFATDSVRRYEVLKARVARGASPSTSAKPRQDRPWRRRPGQAGGAVG